MITIPKVENPKVSNTGIVIGSGGYAYAEYRDGTKNRRKKIGNEPKSEKDRNALRALRNQFYEMLLEQGATVATRTNRAAKAEADPDRYIQHRRPWVVRIDSKIIAECRTKKEALAARNKFLGLT